MRAVQWEKHVQVRLDLSHHVTGLPPVSKRTCFSRLLLLWRST